MCEQGCPFLGNQVPDEPKRIAQVLCQTTTIHGERATVPEFLCRAIVGVAPSRPLALPGSRNGFSTARNRDTRTRRSRQPADGLTFALTWIRYFVRHAQARSHRKARFFVAARNTSRAALLSTGVAVTRRTWACDFRFMRFLQWVGGIPCASDSGMHRLRRSVRTASEPEG